VATLRGQNLIRRLSVPPFEALEPFLPRLVGADADLRLAVSQVLEAVLLRGDLALQEYGRRIDGVDLGSSDWELDAAEWQAAPSRIAAPLQEALSRSIRRVTEYHQRQKETGYHLAEPDGSLIGMKVAPLDRVGIYVPGDKGAYPSSVIMNAVPALVAGVQEIVALIPPRGISDVVLAACALSGVTRVFQLGGAPAIAALAYGTRTVPRVDKIVGPGNRWVTEAKRQVAGQVGIDMIAGPAELLVVADQTARIEWVAADLIAQAEHDPDTVGWCVTTDPDLAESLPARLDSLLADTPEKAVAREALEKNGLVVLAGSMREAIEVVNRRAPQHVEVMTEGAERVAGAIRNAGAIFLGDSTPEPVGDYLAGPSHVLPTGGTARYASPLGVYDFMKRTSIIRYARSRLSQDADAIVALAEAEGLPGHAEAVRLRMGLNFKT
jgi:histidinol dehydrogenase